MRKGGGEKEDGEKEERKKRGREEEREREEEGGKYIETYYGLLWSSRNPDAVRKHQNGTLM